MTVALQTFLPCSFMRPTPNPSGQAPMQNIMLDFTNLYRSDFRSAHKWRYIAKLITRFFLCVIHPSLCKENAGLKSFGVFKTSFSISEFCKFMHNFPLLNFDKKCHKKGLPCKFFLQIKFSNLEFAQKCQKIEFLGGKSSFKGKNRVFSLFFFGKIEFPSKRTKNKKD